MWKSVSDVPGVQNCAGAFALRASIAVMGVNRRFISTVAGSHFCNLTSDFVTFPITTIRVLGHSLRTPPGATMFP